MIGAALRIHDDGRQALWRTSVGYQTYPDRVVSTVFSVLEAFAKAVRNGDSYLMSVSGIHFCIPMLWP